MGTFPETFRMQRDKGPIFSQVLRERDLKSKLAIRIKIIVRKPLRKGHTPEVVMNVESEPVTREEERSESVVMESKCSGHAQKAKEPTPLLSRAELPPPARC